MIFDPTFAEKQHDRKGLHADGDGVAMHVISLGAGVQSTTMALMAAHGEITPMPDCAIFADTGWEPKAVYEHLEWLMSANVLPFPVHVVNAGNIREHIVAQLSPRSGKFSAVPWHLTKADGERGIGRRECTSHYKVEPIRKKVRELLCRPKGPVPAGSVVKWLGISVDEIFRVTPSKVKFEINRFPLIERRLHRSDCLLWLERNGYPRPPKSSCVGCPYHSNDHWREMKLNAPQEFADAVEIDRVIRDGMLWKNIRGRQYMHHSHQPLDEVDLSTAADQVSSICSTTNAKACAGSKQ